MIQAYRHDTGAPIYFTLDAGPNIHLLYPHEFEPLALELLTALKQYCVNGLIIKDNVGQGPQKLI